MKPHFACQTAAGLFTFRKSNFSQIKTLKTCLMKELTYQSDTLIQHIQKSENHSFQAQLRSRSLKWNIVMCLASTSTFSEQLLSMVLRIKVLIALYILLYMNYTVNGIFTHVVHFLIFLTKTVTVSFST